MDILEKVKEYYKMEFNIFLRVLTINKGNDFWWQNLKNNTINNTLSRFLGIALFVQKLGVPYENVSPIYEEYKEKIESYY